MTKRSTRLPSICVDENLSPAVAEPFREFGFRVLEVSKHPGLRGRDERDFIGDLLRENAVFVTGDAEFVQELVDEPRRHAGIVFIEQTASPNDKLWFCRIAADGIVGRCSDGPHAFAGRIVYIANDGIHAIYRGRETLAYSWPALNHLAEREPVQRVRNRRRRSGMGAPPNEHLCGQRPLLPIWIHRSSRDHDS